MSCRLPSRAVERSGVWWSARVHGFSRFAPAGAAWRACRCALAARVHGFSRFALFLSRIDRGKGFFLARFWLNARLSSNIEANQSATPRKTGKSVQAHRLGLRTCRPSRLPSRAPAKPRTCRSAHLPLRARRSGAAAFRGRGAVVCTRRPARRRRVRFMPVELQYCHSVFQVLNLIFAFLCPNSGLA